MSRLLCLTLATFLSLAGFNLAYSQDTAPASSTDSSSGPNIGKLQAENTKLKKEVSDAAQTIATLQTDNAALKKEVSDATQTITKLQSQLTDAQQQQQKLQQQVQQLQQQVQLLQQTAPAPAAPAVAETTAPAAPTGPQKALPLDSTNAVANAAAPGAPGAADVAPAGSRTYTVAKGDSLWKIAHKMYPGDTKNGVHKLQEANKDAIGGKPLKIGQVLIVPQ